MSSCHTATVGEGTGGNVTGGPWRPRVVCSCLLYTSEIIVLKHVSLHSTSSEIAEYRDLSMFCMNDTLLAT